MGYKVTLTSGGESVVFEASSPITESRASNYDGFGIVHLPTELWTYKNTGARHFAITGKIVSRNANEAQTNSYYVDLIRSWILPDFGGSGATPPIVKLSAYLNTNIREVPCILKSYGITFPEDVDWIFDGVGNSSAAGPVMSSSAMPVICQIQVELEDLTDRFQNRKLFRPFKFIFNKLKTSN